ncbi:hypothetical protein F2Q70_00024534 [Brassica cretica]|uniref:Uncharacterized protein n=1 Tax=Brassica cretica TaxID=69181 RepID=A0A8S9L1X7_BRACR|nr:hypothetical protein F2Q70_00024534 [Brassica cretica]
MLSRSHLFPISIFATVVSESHSKIETLNRNFADLTRKIETLNRKTEEEGTRTVELVEPATDVLERRGAGDVVDDEGSDGAAVVGGGDGAEAFLAGGIPNLSFDFFVVDEHALGLELDADGGFGVGVELVAGVAGEEISIIVMSSKANVKLVISRSYCNGFGPIDACVWIIILYGGYMSDVFESDQGYLITSLKDFTCEILSMHRRFLQPFLPVLRLDRARAALVAMMC